MAQRIVINEHLFFELSESAAREYAERKGRTVYEKASGWMLRYWLVPPAERPEQVPTSDAEMTYLLDFEEIERDDPDLIAVVEKYGADANTENAQLKIVEVPDGVKWYVDPRESGREWIAEEHRTWQ